MLKEDPWSETFDARVFGVEEWLHGIDGWRDGRTGGLTSGDGGAGGHSHGGANHRGGAGCGDVCGGRWFDPAAGEMGLLTTPESMYTANLSRVFESSSAVQAGLAVAWATGANAEQAFAALAPFTMMAMTFWFRSREDSSAA